MAGLASAGTLAGCGGSDRSDMSAPADDGLVVASFAFAESRLLVEIYAGALEAEGIDVRRELDLGSRELVLPALRQGLVDVVPEYAGSALDAVAPGAPPDVGDAAAVAATLQEVVGPWGLQVLEPSRASNENAVVVTADYADQHRLEDVSDLRELARGATLGGPPECPSRPRCIPGLADRYSLDFERFVPLAGEGLVRRALEDGIVDVGILFSTDASLAAPDLVVLTDDQDLQRADNIVPLVRRDAVDRGVVDVLDDVSRRLTTANLRLLNWRLANAGTTPAIEARGWLIRQGLVGR